MAVIDVVNQKNEKVGTLEMADAVFGTEVNSALLHEAVVMQRACERQGTAAAKTKGFVSGGGKKPWRQKGTGRARAGSIRSPLWRGGGVVFGPTPRSYAYTMPKKKARLALASALSAKVNDGAVRVIESLDSVGPKTKSLLSVLDSLRLGGTTTLIVVDEIGEALLRAAANLPGVKVEESRRINTYDVLRYKSLLLSRRGAEKIVEEWKG